MSKIIELLNLLNFSVSVKQIMYSDEKKKSTFNQFEDFTF